MNLIFWSISLRPTPTLFCFRDCHLFIGLWMIFLYQTSQMFSKSLWHMLLLMDPEKVKDYQFCHIASIIVLSFKFSASVFFFFLVQSLSRSPSMTSRSFFCLVLAFIFLSMEIFQFSWELLYFQYHILCCHKHSFSNISQNNCILKQDLIFVNQVLDYQCLHNILLWGHSTSSWNSSTPDCNGGHSTTSSQSSSKKLQSVVIGMCKKTKVVNDPVILQECKNTRFWTSLNQCTWCDQNFTVVVTIASC
jgi:hypothetical protein